jgi:GNAT superfamily N-acetyltransferase
MLLAPMSTKPTLRIRPALPDDAELIHHFIVELATYEREPDAVRVSPEELWAQLSGYPPPFEALIAELDGAPAGFAVYYHSYSTWRGRQGIWLEDLFVEERLRRHGIGRALLYEVARIAEARACPRLEWSVLNWNQPAIEFYRALGAEPLDEWTVFRLTGAALSRLAR